MYLCLKLFTRFFVNMRRSQNSIYSSSRWYWYWTRDYRTCRFSGFYNFFCRLIKKDMIISPQANSDCLISHLFISYLFISVTTPAPTVCPPSRIAKRNSLSIAIGVINSTSNSTLSPGITISTPLARVTTPVTSVVLK